MNDIVSAIGNRMGRLVAAALAFTLLGWGSVYADAPPPRELDAAAVIHELGEALAEGRKDTAQHLSRLGFEAQVDELRKVDSAPIHTFSPVTMIEGLYRRAEAHKEGEGARFLAVLYHDMAEKSAALAIDPDFEIMRKYSADELNRKLHPIVFAPLDAVSRMDSRRPLPDKIERAIGKIAQHYSGSRLAQARAIILKNFRKPEFNGREFERVLAESSSSRDVWRRLLESGTPPPRADVALRGIFEDAMAGSAALSSDASALSVMEELSTDLPSEVERYRRAESQIESRRTQAKEAAKLKEVDRTKPSEVPAIIGRFNDNPPPDLMNGGGGGGGGGPLKEGPSPSHHSKPMTTEANSFARRYTDYTSNTFTNGTPRHYRTAIRSARAGRGVSAGGHVQSSIKSTPTRAVWLSNRKDDRFGRLFVEFKGDNGKPGLIGASRVLFADSLYAASSALWGMHDVNAQFKDGEILILMSMDPDSSVTANLDEERCKLLCVKLNAGDQTRAKILIKEKRNLLPSFRRNEHDQDTRAKLFLAGLELDSLFEKAYDQLDSSMQKKYQEMEAEMDVRRGIVLHPAIVGRELSWSTARIDFWFNRLDDLSREAATMDGGKRMPDTLRTFRLKDRASTWQYFEFDSRISLGVPKGRTAPLVVASLETDGQKPSKAAAAVRSHFGISIFGPKPGPKGTKAEDGLYRVDDLEGEVQPMLDWLATNHHDFMRLNDFSEAFSLLRWLKSANVQVTVIDMDGEGIAIATPDRVHIDAGPGTGN